MQLSLTIDGKKYVVDVEVIEGEEVRMPAELPTSTIQAGQPVTAPPPRPQPAAPAADGLPDEKVCRSPIAGIVQRVNVQPGQKLQVNDLLVVLEAMKMETNITAHTAGTVKSILATVGEAVKSGQPLIEFE
ncbi:MAG: acetyl-CoA carboxylase biotin carboxyl carrier protein subunit [Chlorobiaceae bacterium]|nr:acetyl-CoA carboxylase biotin carboxyl carrier protein subunit [Chlorobiales bacterium]NTU91746.1 acetyl-CoA carboxylase biotin carboxyl carrier protein subunit [Chlorobiaceae bacterium]NTV24802.1 acetyl-CoA carboxylase biotin carboxyl carrier protein subunit [Chlorobiaceae bacterium]